MARRALSGKPAHSATRARAHHRNLDSARPLELPGGCLHTTQGKAPPGTPRNPREPPSSRNPKGCGNGSQLARERDSLPPHTPHTFSARTPPPTAHHPPKTRAVRSAASRRTALHPATRGRLRLFHRHRV